MSFTAFNAFENDPYRSLNGAGRHHEKHRFNNTKRFSGLLAPLKWQRKRLPSPGAQNYAFETYGLSEFAVPGPGYGPRAELRTLQGPQSYLPTNAVVTNGLGGVVAGQIILQGLYDPNTNTYAGVPIPNS